MIGRMKPHYYTSQSHYELEMEMIFRKLWIFAGFKFSVSTHNQFFTRDIAGIPIVVQNFDGKISAFVNSCAHRLAKIQTDEFGCRPLICKYHGWKYDDDGKVGSMPFEKKYYKFCENERQNIKIPKVSVKCLGELVFVNLSEDPISFNKQIHPVLALNLMEMSRALDAAFMYSVKKGKYNWKLPFENLNDGLHPLFVHTNTIAQDVDFEGAGYSANEDINLSNIHLDQLSYTEAVGEFKNPKKQAFHELVERFGSTDRYYNWLVYPNLHIASFDGGYTFLFEYYHPTSVCETELHSFILTGKKKKTFSTHSAQLWDTLKGSRVVLDEDQEIMEHAQAGMNLMSPNISQGAYEEQNKRIDSWYMQQISRDTK